MESFSIKQFQKWLRGRQYSISENFSKIRDDHNQVIERLSEDIESDTDGIEPFFLKSKLIEASGTNENVSKQVWQLQVILELVGENKVFKNSQEAFSSLNWNILRDFWEANMTQYEAARRYVEMHNNGL